MTIKVYIYYKYLVNSLLQIHVLKIGGLWILEDSNYWIITLCSGAKFIEIRLNENPICMHIYLKIFGNTF